MGTSRAVETPWRDRTVGSAALLKLEALNSALGLRLNSQAAETLRLLLGPVAEQVVGVVPDWNSDITDDGTPFEFSLAIDRHGVPEVRVLVERRGHPFGVDDNWTEGTSLHDALARTHGIDLERFRRIADLFMPEPSGAARFAIWHAASLSQNASEVTRFKVYLNPDALGAERAHDRVRSALERLGMPHAWEFIEDRLSLRSQNRLIYFALDLHSSEEARAKVYVAHDAATVDDVERAATGTRDYVPGHASRWARGLLGTSGPFVERPLITTYAFSRAAPLPQATSHFPVRSYLATDQAVFDNYLALMDSYDVDVTRLASGLAQWAERPLSHRRGMVTYVSCRMSLAGIRSTLYLAPQLYTVDGRSELEPRQNRRHSFIRERSPERMSLTMRAVQEHVEWHTSELRRHTFLRRLDAGQQPLAAVRSLARKLTFFVLAFQDMLRVAAKRISDPTLSKLARIHQQEDKGHDVWFLLDLRGLSAEPEVGELFSRDHEAPRDVAYELLALILRARDDRARIAVLMVLEATAAEFFPRIVECVEQLGRADEFIFFGRHHMAVEQSHTSATPEEREDLAQIDLDSDVAVEVLSAVDDAFGAMTRLATELDRSM